MTKNKARSLSFRQRRFWHRLRREVWSVVNPLGYFADWWMRCDYRHAGATLIDGICVGTSSLGMQGEWAAHFPEYVRDALFLIRYASPCLYRRVVQNVRYIADTITFTDGQFEARNRACEVDLAVIVSDDRASDREWHVSLLASVIVHESTHAYLHARYIPYTRANRVRIERICINRENYFVSRLLSGKTNHAARLQNAITDAQLADSLSSIDKSRWVDYWRKCRERK